MEEGAAPLRDRLIEELQANKNVVWLVTGGSSMPLSVAVMRDIPDDLTKNLTIYLTDERYGEVGHPDSNSKMLEDMGFDHKQARVTYTLAPSLSLDQTVDQLELSVRTAFDAANIVIAQVGMGPDGHIFGILPGSPAVGSDNLVAGYESDPFTRITLTPKAIKQYVTAAYVFAFGEAKKPQLEKLLQRQVSVAEQPAQVLKQIPEAYVYNDQINGEV
jgi:6-phosphogluconolactonase/glucosamine-6-phosphate isomerase/deaminase